MSTGPQRTCPTCGNELSEAMEFCPVCMLRGALAGQVESGESSAYEDTLNPTPEQAVRRFEHYELLTGEEGKPVELGRGAMGVTYKAVDVDLHCPVTLKVISEKYVGDESARLRFLREARAAAKVHHPNVASVFHLGSSGGEYFYAMEFVEGETLESLIKRSGRLEVNLALEIVSQVAAGLEAVQEQKLVHRDIKPTNIMVRLKGDDRVTAKIIDLGLAKGVSEPGSESAISTPGAFAGTPDFASPEQFAGLGLDIRSDLYSLGVTLWEMLTGRAPFCGTPGEVMHQHQHAPLPLEQLEEVPQPVVVLLEILLEKDPARRFQNPTDLLKVVPAVMRAVKARRTIKHQSLRMASVQEPGSGPDESSPIRVPKRSIAVLPFSSLSDNKRNAYFADGVQDEILSNLAKVSQLKVISRTSVMTFLPGANRNLRSIAESLGVANVVEGTVRRDGNRVRVTIRLVDARKDETLWSETYNRDLDDIFAIQSDIAQKVTMKLSARLSLGEQKSIVGKSTSDLEAYDLYLQAKELVAEPDFGENWRGNLLRAIQLLERATLKDPKFTLAYCLVARGHDDLYHSWLDKTPERRALGDASVDEALRLEPDLPEAHLAAAYHLYLCYHNYERASVQIAIARRHLPNSPEALWLRAKIDRRQGRWEESTSAFGKACSLDPRNPQILYQLGLNYCALRRYKDAARTWDRVVAIGPDKPVHKILQPFIAFLRTGDATSYRAALDLLPPSMKYHGLFGSERFSFALYGRDWAAANEILRNAPGEDLLLLDYYGEKVTVPRGCGEIWVAALQGKHPAIEAGFGAAREQLAQRAQAHPEEPMLLSVLGVIDAFLGRKQEAIKEARRAVEIRPISEDAQEGSYILRNLAIVYTWTNESDLAFQELAVLFETPPYPPSAEFFKIDPTWDPIRKDSRFDKLLAQLASNQSLRKRPFRASRAGTRKSPARPGPSKVSVARLPVTGSDLFGREEDIAFLDRAWANEDVNVATIVGWAGVGKSTLVNHWLRRMASEHYRSAELIFGWSFYRQCTSGNTSSADEFVNAALTWFEDPDPRLGTAWEKGQRLAKLVAQNRTLLILDGLEPLQNPPGPQEGRLSEPSLQALLRELAAFNEGLCLITTRTPVADIADHEGTSAPRRELDQLSSDAGAMLLRALGAKGDPMELRSASDEFRGHCLALTLLGSYLSDAYGGDIRRRNAVAGHLGDDVRQVDYARKVMESYESWLGQGPELAILRMLGLFDRPADQKALDALLKSPAIRGLTESLTDLRPTEWRAILAKLRSARILAPEDTQNPGLLDMHPLVREYFGEQLRNQERHAWKECNRRLYHYYRTLAPQLPDSFKEMEPLFSAVICGCNAGLYREALHEVYIPRIQRQDSSFAAKVLGARGALLVALAHFFERGRWGSLVPAIVEGRKLSVEDQVYVLLQAALNLTATRDWSPEARTCCERMELLCKSLDRPWLLYVALTGQWLYSLAADRLTATMKIAKRIYSLANEQSDAALMMGANRALGETLYFLGDFKNALCYVKRGIQIWRSGVVQSPVEEVDAPVVTCMTTQALCEWHFGEMTASGVTIAEAISLARKLNDMQALALALYTAGILAHLENNPEGVERFAVDLIELSTRCNFATWLPLGDVHLGWARALSGDTTRGLLRINEGIKDYRERGSMLGLPFLIALRAKALHFAGRTSEALSAIKEAEAEIDRSEVRWWCSELHRLRVVFLADIGARETQIAASFGAAIRIAREQKSISLVKRAEGTYAEYRKQKASASGERRFRLPLW